MLSGEEPTCRMNGIRRSASSAQIGSWSTWPGERPPGGAAATQTAPRPSAWACSISASAAATLSSGTMATPMRRLSPWQNAAMARLWARAVG